MSKGRIIAWLAFIANCIGESILVGQMEVSCGIVIGVLSLAVLLANYDFINAFGDKIEETFNDISE